MKMKHHRKEQLEIRLELEDDFEEMIRGLREENKLDEKLSYTGIMKTKWLEDFMKKVK